MKIIAILLVLVSCSSLAQTRFYLEPQVGTNLSFSRLNGAPTPGFQKATKVGLSFSLLAGIKICKNLYLESGVLYPVTSLKYKVSHMEGPTVYAEHGTAFPSFPLLLKKNIALKHNNNLSLKGGAAYTKQGNAYSPSGGGGTSGQSFSVEGRAYSGEKYNVTLLGGIGMSKKIGKIGTFSLNLMYGKGLKHVMFMNVDYTTDGITSYKNSVLSQGSFLSLQVGYLISAKAKNKTI